MKEIKTNLQFIYSGLKHCYSGKVEMKNKAVSGIISLTIIVCAFFQTQGFAANNKKLLFLVSYHQGFTWSDDVVSGITDRLKDTDRDIQFYIEYMDTRRWYDDAQYLKNLHDIYQYKYRGVRFDAIITVDDNAYNFMLKKRDQLFPEVPVVFCGVNYFSDDQLTGIKNFTGIAESLDVKGTIDLILKLQPKIANINIISDKSSFGTMQTRLIKNVIQDYKGKNVRFNIWDNLSVRDFAEKAKKLSSNSAILYVVIVKDREGRPFNPSEYLPNISKEAAGPIYGVDENLLPYGIVGGSLKSGLVHGMQAAEIAIQVLKGTQASQIPVIKAPKFVAKFRYDLLTSFQIELDRLPAGSVLIGKPFSFYETYKNLVWIVFGAMAFLLLFIAILALNIVRRKKAEVSLRRSEEKYRTLFENSGDPIYINTREGGFVDVNQSFLDLFGYAREEIADLTTEDIYADPENRPRVLKEIDQKGYLRDFENWYKKKDGTKIECLLTATLRRADDGSITGYEGVIRDISERKHLEAQLRQSQKMEGIGTLAGGIAHEFNNILGIIIGNTELAIDDVPEWNPAKESLKEIRKASMRAKDVVRHILSFARKTPAQRKPIQISTIIRDSLKLMRASIPTTIEIRQNISCGSEMILADPTEINQILMNLCTNSVHALSEETGVLEVNLENEKLKVKNEELGLEAGRYVKLTVKDTGSGIEPKIMDRIFDPYFTTKDIGEGTGMGLAVAYGIIKKHDGEIKVSSELGIGTVVEVLFPLIDETVTPEVEEEPEVLPTGNERVLFVDDEVSLGKMAKQMLERLGYQVITNTNPKEALALFKSEPDQFDLVVTDMAMSQMAGDRLAQELMNIRKDIPVILCTGHSARIDEDRAKGLGLAAYVMKPLVTRDFANTVRRVLDAAKESAQI